MAGRVAVVVLGVPVLFVWAWWTQHFLLSGRIAWRPLLPGAVTIALGLVALGVGAGLLLSTSITTQHDEYGPIGVVFMMLSWLIALSIVLLGGALLGAALAQRPRPASTTAEGDADTGAESGDHDDAPREP
ncbi:hypothetical protein PHK61_29135 [Actinomycetospora lutea]|uniref:hypothetical protein n=1 Tax=Actinomycetospora lutea TaxID=663604 RepID=UPI002365CC83|nr:hypothetical protein [Actinomycetospora lutea]MDD7942486.1 hypothetical protein [Actinomycetospora lutea]